MECVKGPTEQYLTCLGRWIHTKHRIVMLSYNCTIYYLNSWCSESVIITLL